MREPYSRFADTGQEHLPYSQESSHVLRCITQGVTTTGCAPAPSNGLDIDFRRRYAAILLKERGL